MSGTKLGAVECDVATGRVVQSMRFRNAGERAAWIAEAPTVRRIRSMEAVKAYERTGGDDPPPPSLPAHDPDDRLRVRPLTWPDTIPGLGRRQIEAFTPCARCGTGTWAFYGPRPLCLRCATLRRLA